MGLFDRLRRNDDNEEVELRPRSQPDVKRTRRRVNNPRRSTRQDLDAGEQPDEEVDLEEMWDDNRQRKQRDRRTRRRKRNRSRTDSRTEEDDDDDSSEFILPGMKSVADDDEADAADADDDFGVSDEKLDRLLDQNEQIITLLEEIANMAGDEPDTGSDTGSSASDTGMW